MLLSEDELAAELESVEANVYHDPTLKHDRKAYLICLNTLVSCGLVGLSQPHLILCQLGLFAHRRWDS